LHLTFIMEEQHLKNQPETGGGSSSSSSNLYKLTRMKDLPTIVDTFLRMSRNGVTQEVTSNMMYG